MMLDYWYAELKSVGVVAFVESVQHVLSSGKYLTLNPLEENIGEGEIKIAMVDEGKEEKPRKPVVVIHFDFDRWKVKEKEKEKLKVLDPQKSYFLVGHADWIGKEGYNYRLSLKRAEETKRILKGMGFYVVGLEGKGEAQCDLKKGHRISRALIKELEECRKVEIFEKEE